MINYVGNLNISEMVSLLGTLLYTRRIKNKIKGFKATDLVCNIKEIELTALIVNNQRL